MSRPRIFVSSTYYDLKHVRASLDNFIESLGYEAVLSEKGDIAYAPDQPLDESCYREVRNTDIFVLIVGGRYGSERSGAKPLPKGFFDRYDSVTKLEYKAAREHDVPTYIFVESAVYAEYQTFLRNKETKDIEYAHVDSVNVFLLIEEILGQPLNNPLKSFDRYEDIEVWLREQWAGLFKDLLQRTSSQKQLTSLQAQVTNLEAIGGTLQRYLEEVVQNVAPTEAASLIQHEKQKLLEAQQSAELAKNTFVDWIVRCGVPIADVPAILSISSFEKLVTHLAKVTDHDADTLGNVFLSGRAPQKDFNDARAILGLEPLPMSAPRSRSRTARKSHNKQSE